MSLGGHSLFSGGGFEESLRTSVRDFLSSSTRPYLAGSDYTAYEVRCIAPPEADLQGGGALHFSLAVNAHHFLRPTAGQRFTYYTNPHVRGVAPTGGPVTGGTVVTVRGKGFNGLYGNTQVCSGGVDWSKNKKQRGVSRQRADGLRLGVYRCECHEVVGHD